MVVGSKQNLARCFRARDYVSTGLVALYDAIENVGWGKHANHMKIWKDLVGTSDLDVSEKIEQEYDCVQINPSQKIAGNDISEFFDMTGNGRCTCEIVAQVYQNFDRVDTSENCYVSFCNGPSSGLVFESNDYWTGAETRKIPVWYRSGAFEFLSEDMAGVWNQIQGSIISTINATVGSSFFEVFSKGMIKGRQSSWITDRTFDSMQIKIGAAQQSLPVRMRLHCIRFYNRALTREEIASNYEIDQARFGI